MTLKWRTSQREIALDRTLVMGILNVTPDSFSDGGRFRSVDDAVRRAETMIAEGASVIDVGGESTRPGSARVPVEIEIRRTVPVIAELVRRFGVPVSIDTSKSEVAKAACDAGAEIVNDVSGFRFDPAIASVAAGYGAAAVLMHLRGTFETMHSQTPVSDILSEVSSGWNESLRIANEAGVADPGIVLDIGLGFGKTFEQNLELVAKLAKLVEAFKDYPVLVGASRKSFIGRVLEGIPAEDRLGGSLGAAAISVWNGARILRVHDVAETVKSVRVVEAILEQL